MRKKITFGVVILFLVIIIIVSIGKNKETNKNTSLENKINNDQSEPQGSKQEILIGIEYAQPGMAKQFSELGIPAVKQYPDAIRWDKMQSSVTSEINFSFLDNFVKEYQEAGFTTLVIALKPHSVWASKNIFNNPSPKEEYLDLYEKWVGATVERYDQDGQDDLPGLKEPVIYYEVGTEFSSYEPEPVEDYLKTLEKAHQAAHSAFSDVKILPAAFLTSTVFKNHPSPSQYEEAFNSVSKRIMEHSLEDIRKVLDRPDIFDVLNFHSLADPYEIEDNVSWLKLEMENRGYQKPIIISDTGITPFIGYGNTTSCQGNPAKLGLIVFPAKEEDRCRLADYFKKLINNDKDTLAWTRSFVAQDGVKRVVVAAEQSITLINTAFMEELSLAQGALFQAGAGNNSWAGMTETQVNVFNQERTIIKIFPSFYALKQLSGNIRGYSSVQRLEVKDRRIRAYKFEKPTGPVWIMWFELEELVLPGDSLPQIQYSLPVENPSTILEPLIIKEGQKEAESLLEQTVNGKVDLTLTPKPIFVFPAY